MFSLSDYRFELPKHLIAETAASPAHNAKMMVINRDSGDKISDAIFADLPKFLDKNSVLFFNNSRVLRARIPLRDIAISTPTGEKICKDGEIFFLKNRDKNHFEALVRPGKKFKIGSKITLGNAILEVVDFTDSGRIFRIDNAEIYDILENFGELPLPPYIEYSREKERDYQNTFARENGSVAAPTAGLHFTEELLANIQNEKNFVTLHIGLGTFKTIDTDDIRSYNIHSENCEVPLEIFAKISELKSQNKIITAVGTTACRTLESLPSVWKNLDKNLQKSFGENVENFWNHISQNADTNWTENIIIHEKTLEFSTRAYITPGYKFSIIDELITNFHLPESSLLVLVSALIWQENLLKNYHDAIAQEYKFFSFGDGMYIKKSQ